MDRGGPQGTKQKMPRHCASSPGTAHCRSTTLEGHHGNTESVVKDLYCENAQWHGHFPNFPTEFMCEFVQGKHTLFSHTLLLLPVVEQPEQDVRPYD